jgi:protein-tyrosine-phosphatase
MAEAITNRLGKGRFHAFSAGSRPEGKVSSHTIELLIDLGYETAKLRSKSWEEFARPGAPVMELIITVCDSAAGESCPTWPGHPATAHWSIPDPALAHGRAVRATLAETYRMLEQRISALVDLPRDGLDGPERQSRLRDIAAREETAARAWSH